jgi:hypothetical protein
MTLHLGSDDLVDLDEIERDIALDPLRLTVHVDVIEYVSLVRECRRHRDFRRKLNADPRWRKYHGK